MARKIAKFQNVVSNKQGLLKGSLLTFGLTTTKGETTSMGKVVSVGGIATGGTAFGSVSKDMAFTAHYLRGVNSGILYLAKNGEGGYMSRKMASVFAARLKQHIDNPGSLNGVQWDPLSSKYKEWKSKEYAGKGMWDRTGQLKYLIQPLKYKSTGYSVGIPPKPISHKHAIGGKLKRGQSRYTVAEVQYYMEFGSAGGSGHAALTARPLFTPALKQFMRTDFDNINESVMRAIDASYNKFYRAPVGAIPTERKISETTSEYSIAGSDRYSENPNMYPKDEIGNFIATELDKRVARVTGGVEKTYWNGQEVFKG